jgi:hypothetical protein
VGISLSTGSLWERVRPRPAAQPERVAGAGPETVRQAMDALADRVGGARGTRLKIAALRCADLQSLWFLRPSFMQAMAAECGEREARRRIADLDALFAQGWPGAPVSRPGALE